ncbi:MAG: type II TA system antitoxin MqsA family protein [Usitatibacter sp.]
MCDSLGVQEVTYEDVINTAVGEVTVTGLRRFRCPSCEALFVDDAQSRHNLVRTQLASGQEPRYVLAEAIYSWRTRVGLSQRECGRLFGGGVNAFSKYENGEVTQSEPMDNLLWLAMTYPGVIVALASRRRVDLASRVVLKCGHIVQSYGANLSPTWPISKPIDPIHESKSIGAAAAATAKGQAETIGGQLKLHPGAGLLAHRQ